MVAGLLDPPQVVDHVQSECQHDMVKSTLEPLLPESPADPVQKFIERPWLRFIWSGLGRFQPCDQHRAAWQVLSRILGASGSGRLFHEVRQNSLCYAVGGGCHLTILEDSWPAGTTPDRAAETVQVVEEVMHGILNGARLKKKSLGPKKGSFRPLRFGSSGSCQCARQSFHHLRRGVGSKEGSAVHR